MLGENVTLVSTNSGHYAIPITNRHIEFGITDQNISFFTRTNIAEDIQNKPKKVATKLHRQFCHCSALKLKELVNNSVYSSRTQELNKEIDILDNSCNICKLYKKAPAVPSVGLPLSYYFNGCVAMDLFIIKR